MEIDCSFNLTDIAVSAMRNQSKNMLNNISSVDDAGASIADMAGTKSDMDTEAGIVSRVSLIDMDSVPVRMTNLIVAAQTYEANVGLLGRYKQMTEAKLELMG
jgi:flagellar basal body rod protein FlgC